MITLTIGYVSGIIAAIIFVLQFVVPNALIVILVGLLKNSHSAVTWSVVERNLLSSHWPVLLRSDSAATRGVDRLIRLVTWLRPLGLFLITVAAIVTPLGLYDEITPEPDPVHLQMTYVSDNGPFGFGTPSREQVYFTRKCGWSLPIQCPGTTTNIEYGLYEEDGEMYADNATWDDIDLRVPKVLAELYQSGLHQQPGSVSSFFDIQSRQWGWAEDEGVMQNKSYVADSFRYLATVALDDTYEAIEGLIVDTRNGAIGFRNHTVPDAAGLGAEWSEDLLFIEPVTECVPMNVSIEFRVPFSSNLSSELLNITLVDNGGMTDFEQKYPILNLDGAQTEPQLRNRAYKAGWMTNVYNMLTMNLTRPSPDAFGYMKSHVGARYPLVLEQTNAKLAQLSIRMDFGSLLDPPDPDYPMSNYTLEDNPGANYSNPFGMSYQNFSDVSMICSGAGNRDLANISNIHVECGLVFGAARRRDGSQTLVFEPGTWYVQDIYSCASTTRASIKNVDFRYNATRETGHTLQALTVVDIQPKNYSSKEEMPLWGVEDTDYYISDLPQFWGLVDPKLEKSANLSTLRREYLYLPGYDGVLSTASLAGFQNIPGNTGLSDILMGTYTSTGATSGVPDFSGATNYAMLARWRELSSTPKTLPKILNLIWTDLAANMFVGTRSWNTKTYLPPNLQDPKYKKRQSDATDNSDGETLVPVKLYARRIRYRWYFAIPAILSLLLIALIVAAAFLLFVFRRGTPARIDHYLTHLSSGRLLGAMQFPSEDKDAPTTEWIQRVGRQKSDLDKMFPVYRGDVSTSGGLSPFFAQSTGYGERQFPASSDYDTKRRPGSSGGKGYIQISTQDRPES